PIEILHDVLKLIEEEYEPAQPRRTCDQAEVSEGVPGLAVPAGVEDEHLLGVELPVPSGIPEAAPKTFHQSLVQQATLPTVVPWVGEPVLDEVADRPRLARHRGTQRDVDGLGLEVV